MVDDSTLKTIRKDVVVIGAGAAGLMCAIEAGKNGRSVVVIDHAKKPAEKIRISGGGRCNFTNIYASPADYLSQNPRFCISALKRYTPKHFIEWIEAHGIAYHEKTLGQLFCDNSAKDIIAMLLTECATVGADVSLETSVTDIQKNENAYIIQTNNQVYEASSLVVACGGLSIPKMGATSLGYDIAKQFNVPIVNTSAALVPITFTGTKLEACAPLAGLTVTIEAKVNKRTFKEGMVFTHRGLSGPAILQISSYWKEKDTICINLAPDADVYEALLKAKKLSPTTKPLAVLSEHLPKRLAAFICDTLEMHSRLAECSDASLKTLANRVNAWNVTPNGTEGYRTAEVTLGGVSTQALSSKTMEAREHKGLYFIGEVVDVTGHLGGFNFQWAWASGFVAGQYV